MSRPGFLIPLLALAALFFGWRTYDAWTGPVGAAAPAPPTPVAAPVGVSPEEAPPPADLSAPVAFIVARPVFRPDRQPFREEAIQIPQRNYEAELSRFTLLGVLLLGKDKKGVVVGKGGAGRDERWEVAPGDSLPGFGVKDVGTEGLTLTADGREFLLPLYAGGPKGPPGKAPGRTEVAPPSAPAAPPPAASPQPPPAVRPGMPEAPAQPSPAVRPGPVVRTPADNAYAPPTRVPPRTDLPFYRRRGRTIRPNIPGGN
jgi:hypothetical protein